MEIVWSCRVSLFPEIFFSNKANLFHDKSKTSLRTRHLAGKRCFCRIQHPGGSDRTSSRRAATKQWWEPRTEASALPSRVPEPECANLLCLLPYYSTPEEFVVPFKKTKTSPKVISWGWKDIGWKELRSSREGCGSSPPTARWSSSL